MCKVYLLMYQGDKSACLMRGVLDRILIDLPLAETLRLIPNNIRYGV